jgi:hypothetical protein
VQCSKLKEMPTQLKSLEKPKESTQTRETNPKYKELNKSQCQVMDAAKKDNSREQTLHPANNVENHLQPVHWLSLMDCNPIL